MRRVHRARGAFTVVELMLASAIFLVVLNIFLAATWEGEMSFARSVEYGEIHQQARRLIRTVTIDVSQSTGVLWPEAGDSVDTQAGVAGEGTVSATLPSGAQATLVPMLEVATVAAMVAAGPGGTQTTPGSASASTAQVQSTAQSTPALGASIVYLLDPSLAHTPGFNMTIYRGVRASPGASPVGLQQIATGVDALAVRHLAPGAGAGGTSGALRVSTVRIEATLANYRSVGPVGAGAERVFDLYSTYTFRFGFAATRRGGL